MLFLTVICGFYLFGLLMAHWVTLPRQALVSGLGTMIAAGFAGVTLWLLTQTGMTEPWVAIAMASTIALPALMIGLGLSLGWAMRVTSQKRDWRYGLACATAAAPCAASLAAAFAS